MWANLTNNRIAVTFTVHKLFWHLPTLKKRGTMPWLFAEYSFPNRSGDGESLYLLCTILIDHNSSCVAGLAVHPFLLFYSLQLFPTLLLWTIVLLCLSLPLYLSPSPLTLLFVSLVPNNNRIAGRDTALCASTVNGAQLIPMGALKGGWRTHTGLFHYMMLL